MIELTQELARELLDYDPESGVLTYRARDRKWFKSDRAHHTWNTKHAGHETSGSLDSKGYRRVCINNRHHRAHRLIWLWVTGSYPAHDVDHENHVRDDNRWANLREATRPENLKNMSMRSDNTSGVVGVVWNRERSKWQAQIHANGRSFSLGRFTDKADAIAARKAAEIEHGFHPNHGRIAA